jgi:hypothetical protein
MHGAEFVPTKFTLVYLVKQRSIPTTPLYLSTLVLHLSPSTLIMGLVVDFRLSWHPHVAATKAKMHIQKYALMKLTASIWGASLFI